MMKAFIVFIAIFLAINIIAQPFKKEELKIVTQESLSKSQTQQPEIQPNEKH